MTREQLHHYVGFVSKQQAPWFPAAQTASASVMTSMKECDADVIDGVCLLSTLGLRHGEGGEKSSLRF